MTMIAGTVDKLRTSFISHQELTEDRPGANIAYTRCDAECYEETEVVILFRRGSSCERTGERRVAAGAFSQVQGSADLS